MIVPSKARVIPTEQMMRYFQAASIEVSRSYRPTRKADASVVPSMAIHMMPRLLDTLTRSMVKTNSWKKM